MFKNCVLCITGSFRRFPLACCVSDECHSKVLSIQFLNHESRSENGEIIACNGKYYPYRDSEIRLTHSQFLKNFNSRSSHLLILQLVRLKARKKHLNQNEVLLRSFIFVPTIMKCHDHQSV